jgi:AraC-like DNA-binding protein
VTYNTEKYPKQYMYRQVVRSKLFIDEHFTEDIGLSEIADKAHFSKYHFIRLFKNIYELTPNQYLVQVRIEEAKRLLQNGLAVKEVCMSVGFDSISSFKGLFKKLTGKTLTSYQNQQRDLRVSMKTNPLMHIPQCLELDMDRDDAFIRFRDYVKSFLRDPDSAKKEAAKKVTDLIKRHGYSLYKLPYMQQSDALGRLIAELKEPASLTNVTKLGGTGHMQMMDTGRHCL